MSASGKFKILSLDGGGSWALLQAMALESIYEGKTTKEILDSFDLVIANSGGSIMLAGMLTFNTLKEVIDLFLDERSRKRIFSRTATSRLIPAFIPHPKYSSIEKLKGLKSALGPNGDKSLQTIKAEKDLKPEIIIVGFDLETSRATFFSSNSGAVTPPLAACIHASSSAPVEFFDEPATFNAYGRERFYWDGAVGGFNNPVMAGITIAKRRKINLNQIYALSIGTGTSIRPYLNTQIVDTESDAIIKREAISDPLKDIKRMATAILADPPDSASYTAYIMLHDDLNAAQTNPHIVRLSPFLRPDVYNQRFVYPWTLDGKYKPLYNRLVSYSMDAVDQEKVNDIKQLGELWMEGQIPNQPIKFSWDDFGLEIGSHNFEEGKAAWNAIV